MTTFYSLRTDGDQYRITKIVDGEIESSYLSTETECECPAGHRASCRHRQMIPEMLARGICNTHWFWDFDLHRVVDFNGQLKSNIDALNELAAAVGEAQHTEVLCDDEGCPQAGTEHVCINTVGASPAKDVSAKPWRRL